MRSSAKHLWSDQSGAVAALYALALPALIVCGGIAFDYARLVAMDTELQNAADQAALAAVTQLDGTTGACSRASAAAVSLVTNNSVFANDGALPAVVITGESACDATGRIKFWQNKAKTTAATSDANARFVEVTVNARTANYTLTPIVQAFSSGAIDATAFAGLGSAVCKVPPLMMCNPAEAGGNLDFNVNSYKGVGIRLVAGGGGAWAPGNFGYLQTDIGNGANNLELALGANNPPGNCIQADDVTTSTGVQTSVTDAINTRFDIFENGLVAECAAGTGACSPAINARKDVVRPEITTSNGNGNGNGNGNNSLNCGFNTGSDPWTLPSVQYLPDPVSRTQATLPTNMGLPRDICHSVSADGDCLGTASRIGDGNWDRNMYFQVNHPSVGSNWQSNNSLMAFATANSLTLSSISRYDVYRWEIASNNLADRLAYNVSTGGGQGKGGGGGGNLTSYFSYAQPKCATGLAPSDTQLDRRLTAVAVVNCAQEGLNGQEKGVKVIKWVEVFLVEPSIARDRTSASEIYVEIVRQVDIGGGGGSGGQVARRDVPYLIE